VTCDLDTTFKVKRSRSPGRFTHCGVNALGSCSGERGNVLSVEPTDTLASAGAVARRFGANRGRRGAGEYCGGRPPADSLSKHAMKVICK